MSYADSLVRLANGMFPRNAAKPKASKGAFGGRSRHAIAQSFERSLTALSPNKLPNEKSIQKR